MEGEYKMDIKNEVLGKSKDMGICTEGFENLSKSESISGLIEEFWRGIDFCLANNFPTKDYLKNNALSEIKGQHIYVDEECSLSNLNRACFLGSCKITFSADNYSVCRLYVKQNACLKILGTGYSFIMVDALDDSNIDVTCEDNAKVIVNVYSKASVTYQGKGKIKVVYKNRETYEL